MNEEKMEDVRMLEAQIEHLQTTVSALQDQLQDKQKNRTFNLEDQMQTAMSVFTMPFSNSLLLNYLIWSSFHNRSCILAQKPVLSFYRLFLKGDEEEKEEFVSKLKEEVEELRKTLSWQARINGISMKMCTIKTLQSSKSPLVSVLYRSNG